MITTEFVRKSILTSLLMVALFSCEENKNSFAFSRKDIATTFSSEKENIAPPTDQFVYDNEEVIYSFTTSNKKQMFLVKDTNDAYIQYRFGRENNIEMRYPEMKTKESWTKFQYNSYWRGGGIENAGMEIDNL